MFESWSDDGNSGRAEKIALAQFNAIVTEDVIGRRAMKKEIRQRHVIEILLAGDGLGLGWAGREGDLSLFPAFEFRGFDRLDNAENFLNARMEFRKGRFGIGK